jgi:hypothetical protein
MIRGIRGIRRISREEYYKKNIERRREGLV